MRRFVSDRSRPKYIRRKIDELVDDLLNKHKFRMMTQARTQGGFHRFLETPPEAGQLIICTLR